jgi:hypothetical protein
MTVSQTLQETGQTTSGVVLVIFRDPDTPVNTDAIIERTTTSASVANPSGWVEIGTLFNCDTAGSHFIDYLPVSDEVYWYRAKHVSPGFEDSSYIFETSGSSQIIPDIDFTTKPWLLDQTPLQLVMVVTSSNATQWVVVPEVNQPVFGTGIPTVSLIASGNVGPILSGPITNSFSITKPVGSAATASSYVVFKSTLAGYFDGYDRLDFAPSSSFAPITTSSFLELRLTVTSSTLTSIGVSASVSTSVPYGFGIIETSSVGTITNDAFGQWTIGRPTSGEGSVTFIVTSSAANIISDVDTIYVSKDPAPYLTVQAKATNVTENSVTASVDIYDSNNQDSNLTGITLLATSQSLVNFTASQFGSLVQTPGKDSYVFHISRPSYQQGTGRVSFTATKTGYTQDSDALDVPERVDELAKLRTIITPIGTDSSSITVSVAVLDALPLVGSYINLSYNSIGIPAVSPTGSVIVSASEARQFVITRPNFGSGTGRVNFTATASIRVNDTDAVDVPERTQFSVSPGTATFNIDNVTSGSNEIAIQYSFGVTSTAEIVNVFVQESSGSAPTIASVEFTGTRAANTPLYKGDGRQFLTLPISQPGNWILVTFVPYDNFNRRGTITTRRYQSLISALTTPAGFTTASNLSVGDTFVSNSVTIPTSSLSDKIRTYLFGAPYGSDITRTADSGSAQTIIHTGLNPDSSYTWQYFPVNNDGAIGPGSNFINTQTSAGGTLPTPQFSYSAQESGGVWYLYFYIINQSDYPNNVSFVGDVTDALYTFLGNTSEVSQFTHFWLTTADSIGYARFKATVPGYTDSSYSDYQYWFAGSGNPF